MSEPISIDGVESIEDLFEKVSACVVALVEQTGGNIRIDLEDESNPNLIYRFLVDGIEWTRAEWSESGTVEVNNARVFLDRLAKAMNSRKSEAAS